MKNAKTQGQNKKYINNIKNKKIPTLVDVFCGTGGLSLGFIWAGFFPVLAIDKINDCTDTYSYNHPNTEIITGDITAIKDDHIINLLRRQYGINSVDVVVGGPPCESFSTAGPAIRKSGDIRDTLFEHVIRIGSALKAKYILIENIPGLMSKKNNKGVRGAVFSKLLHRLIDYGYLKYDFRVLNAVDFGVPQIRQRLFIIATSEKNCQIVFPTQTHCKKDDVTVCRPWISVEEAFSDLPDLESRSKNSDRSSYYQKSPQNFYQKLMRGEHSDEFQVPKVLLQPPFIYNGELTYHWAPNHRPATIERLKMIRQGEGLRDLWQRLDPGEREKLQKSRILPAKWYIQRFRRLIPSEPSVTVTSHCLDEIAHPFNNRLITVREAARLQSFPDSYQFVGGKWINPHGFEPQDKYEQIGDAVPPLLAWRLAQNIRMGLDY